MTSLISFLIKLGTTFSVWITKVKEVQIKNEQTINKSTLNTTNKV
jgi:hypothetical protein